MLRAALIAGLIASVVAAAASAAGQPIALRVIAPGSGMAGIDLGTPESVADARYGPPGTTGIGFSGWTYANWSWVTVEGGVARKTDELIVLYDHGRAVSISTPSPWAIAGTRFVNNEDRDLAALRSAFGARLRGPYVTHRPAYQGGYPDRFYEIMSTLDNERVHTTFHVDARGRTPNRVLWTIVAFCGLDPSEDVGCGSRAN